MADGGAVDSLVEPGLWIERIGTRTFPKGLPALFLDRDGTINVDTSYPSDPADIVLRPEMLPVIRAANVVGLPAIIVSNQSGIARGYFGWADFAAVNGRLLQLLEAEDCRIDLVLACGYHSSGTGVLAVGDHPMRKPNPGMLLRARDLLDLDMGRSIIIGDKADDMEAGRRAGLRDGWHVGSRSNRKSGDAAFVTHKLITGNDHRRLCDLIAGLGKA
ncbi:MULTISPECIES: HAD-IIIA family hydrolase [unclassified Mesorhizobium]|uniref:D-glycero-alpha-D-manno-heptose-1,7-bisphosphate 7-phosphatase n=1 Tax=unclassified Mesorhizobium TaxID=325217 RepID=UPI000F755F80|nr:MULTISPECIES: HAD-IIIA family hydrolase [unclassified Mesorhizobium]AZO02638.1 HAD-IIIA family hydrolase [Mesorhizobium sp. M2A.F.Ca.ET.043.02.1.1]RUW39884.1 HAD-IIIA family hydrolase [Mesorhizobium sp. M2A.F.Ca.ET.015.02.1.1]RUW72338.1 HAD-IIIA family hydrolase [Mesorhizobium sp. M2A.F.Ca.ET.067.02.1.1]RVC91536.1 HAD-IIIA family hydrolase [Mesorhizobium sp. M2A.F.Ca.ET.017.03.2.1]RVD05437.1 HAD-IIIA family hydrolase [Mesorhizobium sp. M2A.F.Ca.ET.029.05.1.1]